MVLTVLTCSTTSRPPNRPAEAMSQLNTTNLKDKAVTTNSTLPPQAAFHHAILRHLTQHPDGDRRRNIHEAIPDLLTLTVSQRTARLANMTIVRYRHLRGLGLSHIKSAGQVKPPDAILNFITHRMTP